ncbi:S-adenosylmethionine-dependent methyltransferase [Malassezia pachydermatis]
MSYSMQRNNERRKALYSLPRAHQDRLLGLRADVPGPAGSGTSFHGFKAKLQEVDDRIRRNADVLEAMSEFCRTFLGILEDNEAPLSTQDRIKVSETNQDRVRTAMKQMARDWSQEGEMERLLAYEPILDALVARLPNDRRAQRVLVPGAGLGRLAFDIARLGYTTQGNEFSYFMLIPAHFILNATTHVHQHTLYPYIHGASNWVHAADMLRAVAVPDTLPSALPADSDFSMVAGEFVEVYAKPEERGTWNAVATCYFMDTAKNVIRYLEVINALLPRGGYWINVGPLLWHFEHEDVPTVELTLDEILELVVQCGFVIEETRMLEPQMYTGMPNHMLLHHYTPAFWVCRKDRDIDMAPVV